MEESSHSTPSPMSSAASSQDSLHRNAATLHHMHQNPYGHLMTNTLPANSHLGLGGKKKGVKSTLGKCLQFDSDFPFLGFLDIAQKQKCPILAQIKKKLDLKIAQKG
jgi:hypothetical protein